MQSLTGGAARPFPTLTQAWAPGASLWHDAARVLGGSLLIALSAQVAVPFWPVPLTGQTLGVLLVAAALGSRLGTLAVLAYLVEGIMGLPVFAPGGAPGVARLLGPTGGYLIGFLPAAFIVGALAERGWDRRVWTTVLAMAIGNLAIYACGLAWLGRFVAADAVLAAGLLPFLPGDLLKILVAAFALPGAWAFTSRR